MAQTKDLNQPLKRLWGLLSTEKKDLTNIYVFAFFNGILSLSIPLGIQAIINLIQSATTSTSWIVLVVFVLVGLAMAGIFQIFQLIAAERIQQRIFARAALDFSYRIPRFRISALKNYYPPELINRFFDVLTVQKGLYKLLFDFSVASLQIIFGLILLSLYHPFFIAFGVFLFILVFVFFRITSKRGLETSLEESKYKYQTVSWLEEMARNINTFKMAGDTDYPMKKTDSFSGKYLRARRSHFSVLLRQYSSLIFFKVLIAGGLLLLGGLLVFDQQMNIGQFVAAEIVIVLIISSVEKLVFSIDTIYDVLTSLEKLGSVTDLELEPSANEELLELNLDSPLSVKLQDLSLDSPQWQFKILDQINLEVKAGEKLGVAGSMGAGKSSLLQVIAGLFDEYQGRILINDTLLQNINLQSLRSAVGDNLRQEELFEANLLENISLGREGVGPDEAMKLLDLVGLREFTNRLSKGLFTPLPSSGIGLPSSTRSRILMARSLAGKHAITLLEDNWFDVSDEIRARWLDYLCLECPNTVVMATNNRESLQRMDRIVILEKGKIVGEGTYEQLKEQLPC